MAGEVTAACIASFCFHNTTDICFMDAMVEYPGCKNVTIGTGYCKSYASCIYASMEFLWMMGKSWWSDAVKIQQCLLCSCGMCYFFKLQNIYSGEECDPDTSHQCPELPSF